MFREKLASMINRNSEQAMFRRECGMVRTASRTRPNDDSAAPVNMEGVVA